jgi:hypothetical protein
VSRFGIARGLATTRALRYKGRESRSDSDFALPKKNSTGAKEPYGGFSSDRFFD